MLFRPLNESNHRGLSQLNKPIKIAVLDAVERKYWASDEGRSDSQKFIDLLAPLNASASFEVFYVTENKFPQSLNQYDGILLTGSPASVHDDYDWVTRLSDLIRQADHDNKRTVGSCFGHQLIAKTFGGQVAHNEYGWMIGNYRLSISQHFEWMGRTHAETGLYHFNQERVTHLPEAAVGFADSEEYPDFAYTLGDNFFSMQGHPEQPLRAMNNFLSSMLHVMDDTAIEKARFKIHDGKPDSNIWGQWIMDFWVR